MATNSKLRYHQRILQVPTMECPHCGHVNPETNRFCHNCGQSLLAIPAPGPTVVMASVNLKEEELEEDKTATEFGLVETLSLEAGGEAPLLERLEREEEERLTLEAPVPAALASLAEPLATPMVLAAAGYSDAGPQRANNEDNYGVFWRWQTTETLATGEQQQARGFFVVCDGMGGHAGGEVASALALESLAVQFQPFWDQGMPGEHTLRDIVLEANRAIYYQNEVELRREYGRMGTTLVLLVVVDTQAAIAHVGDSRIYQITANNLKQLTRDHEVGEQLIARGVDPMTARMRSDARQLTQALGPFESDRIVPEVAFFELTEPSLFVLCSDGVCDYDLIEQNWKHALLPYLAPHTNLRTGAKELVELANQLNGHDNATAVLVRWA